MRQRNAMKPSTIVYGHFATLQQFREEAPIHTQHKSVLHTQEFQISINPKNKKGHPFETKKCNATLHSSIWSFLLVYNNKCLPVACHSFMSSSVDLLHYFSTSSLNCPKNLRSPYICGRIYLTQGDNLSKFHFVL